jgi:CBS domain-containing protein
MTTVAEVMTRGVEVISPEASVQRAAQRMDELNVGALPVCSGPSLVGMITDRDITVRATAAGLEPNRTRVSEVMTESTRYCTENQDIDDVKKQMGEMQIRRLPVLGGDKTVVGIVSLGDLATRAGGDCEQTLREISSPSEPDRSSS